MEIRGTRNTRNTRDILFTSKTNGIPLAHLVGDVFLLGTSDTISMTFLVGHTKGYRIMAWCFLVRVALMIPWAVIAAANSTARRSCADDDNDLWTTTGK